MKYGHLVFTDLDRSNVSNAYVSGMKEELNMVGNEFNVRPVYFRFIVMCNSLPVSCRKSIPFSHVDISLA